MKMHKKYIQTEKYTGKHKVPWKHKIRNHDTFAKELWSKGENALRGKTLRQSIMGQERKRNLSKMPFNLFSFGHLLLGMEFVCQWNSVGKKLGSFIYDVPYGLGMWTSLYFHSQHWGRIRSRPVHALWMPKPSNNPDYWFSFNLFKPYCCKQHLHNSLNADKLNWYLPT